MDESHPISRRQFLKGSAAVAVGAPYILRTSWAAPDRPSPSNRINMGCIGFRNMGGQHVKTLANEKSVQVVALCDVDAAVLKGGKDVVEKAYAAQIKSGSYKGVATYNDFRELLGRDDIDAVMIATPDHWHIPIGIAAIKAGKDTYIEKPLTLTIAEGRALSDAVRRYGRVHQTGSQQRSSIRYRYACELVRNGRIGALKTIRVQLPSSKTMGPVPPEPVPPGFDYEMWLGQAPWAPYHPARCHYNFRFNLDYSGGQVTNWGAHDLDIAQWGNGTDLSGPTEIEGTGEFPREGLYNTATKVDVRFKYANGVELTFQTGPSGVRFEGTEGWVYVNRGTLDAEPKSILTSVIGPNEIHLYDSRNHWGNFLECVRTRQTPIAS
ncbi:MAG: Gfo/Idh/MocA family oxidoreductase, partial [Armatimonadota bacterium]|nr:Gfo/Idh/MocA family oxidoreductase [Armatimonadota bacterium]